MQRIFIAALAALSLAFIAPAAASAQYDPPYFYPTSNPTPRPVITGLEDHPFGFGANWAPDSPLEADFVDYIAWTAVENDYRLRAGAYDDSVYYTQSGLIGHEYTGPTYDGVNWQVRITRYIPPAIGRLGHYCTYEGFVNGPVLPTPQNVFTQTGRFCDNYVTSSEGFRAPLKKKPTKN